MKGARAALGLGQVSALSFPIRAVEFRLYDIVGTRYCWLWAITFLLFTAELQISEVEEEKKANYNNSRTNGDTGNGGGG